jgi:hypothetical protein
VCDATAISSEDGKYKITFPRTLPRGRAYKFSFREVAERNWSEELPATSEYRRNFEGPVLRYWVGVRFIGEQPANVWSFSDLPADHKPKPGRKDNVVPGTDTGYAPVEFVDLRRNDWGIAWSWREPRKSFIFTAIAMFMAATLNLPMLVGMADEAAAMVSILMFLLFVMAGSRLTFKYFADRNRRRFKSSHHYIDLLQVPPRMANQLRSAPFTKAVTPRQSAVFITSILQPRQYRQRVVETHTLGRRTVRQHVTIEAQLRRTEGLKSIPIAAGRKLKQVTTHSGSPASLPQADVVSRPVAEWSASSSTPHNADGTTAEPLYFAVLMPKKSNLQDNFRLFGHDGAAVPCLSYSEYLQLAAAVLRLLLAVAFNLDDSSVRRRVLSAELRALQLILSRRTATGEAPNMPTGTDWYRELQDLEPEPDTNERVAWDSALDLVKTLTSNYAIVAILTPDSHDRLWVGYERTLIPDLRLGKRTRFAVLVGARPVELSISVKTASTCQSYHLHVHGTEDVFLGKQYLVDSSRTLEKSTRTLETTAGRTVPPHYRFRRRLGQPHAHFYARFFPEPAEVDSDGLKRHEAPQVRLKYLETPPGSLLRAAVSAVACVLLVGLVGIVSSRSLDPGTDAPTVLLVFPALAAAWLGFESPSRGLLEGTMVTRLSLIFTVAISLAASGLYMAHKALTPNTGEGVNTEYSWWRLPREWSILWIHDISWIVLTLFALMNAIVAIYFYVSRTAQFTYLAGRQDGSDLQQHG